MSASTFDLNAARSMLRFDRCEWLDRLGVVGSGVGAVAGAAGGGSGEVGNGGGLESRNVRSTAATEPIRNQVSVRTKNARCHIPCIGVSVLVSQEIDHAPPEFSRFHARCTVRFP